MRNSSILITEIYELCPDHEALNKKYRKNVKMRIIFEKKISTNGVSTLARTPGHTNWPLIKATAEVVMYLLGGPNINTTNFPLQLHCLE